ncbi:PREDICTED: kelch-like protein 24 [Branchiostoma belcheri]|uniref:Kelch-like protein 24 n=1 Tax=Branchiostoma belcheri TaxID=7741 RepID=A0A6P4ZQ11_BRABE|nr:PREDICTED: kelch-like protein 24 [Branchiostoma belcheri]KAI8487135.1 Kelch-like protein 6 [Branchiostoma belcheri]KAI8518954.1 Kelch-like protein 6 [Branchiostoma belcheri]
MDAKSEEVCCPGEFFQRLQQLRSAGYLVDVTLCAEGQEIPCHRLILSACSDYFRAMFSGDHCEKNKDKIDIGGVSAEALQLLVDFAYTAKFNITSDNVHQQFIAANMLQVKPVEDACERFLSNNLSPDMCWATWTLADMVSCMKLSAVARRYALKNFEEVCRTEDFLELPIDSLKTYISDKDLHAKKAEQVLDAVILWIWHDLKKRIKQLWELLGCVCLSSVDRKYLKNIVETGKMFAGVPGINELINDQTRDSRPRRIQQEGLLILGGMTTGSYHPPAVNCNMFELDLHFDRVNTTPLPQCLQNSKGSAANVLGNDVIVTGGETSMSQAWRYNPALNSWTRMGSLKKGRADHGITVLNGKVYVVGGENRSWLSSVEVYNEKTNKWAKVAPLKQAVSSFGIATCCGEIYVFGGRTGFGFSRTGNVQFYNPTRKEWAFAQPLPKPLTHVRACTVNSKIYLAGGQLDSVLCYTPEDDLYEKMADSLCPWFHCSATVSGSEIYITGGRETIIFNHDIEAFSTVQCYDVHSDTMIMGKGLPMSLYGHHIVTVSKQ